MIKNFGTNSCHNFRCILHGHETKVFRKIQIKGNKLYYRSAITGPVLPDLMETCHSGRSEKSQFFGKSHSHKFCFKIARKSCKIGSKSKKNDMNVKYY